MRATFKSSSAYAGPPGFKERSGEAVEIVRPLTAEEADLDETGPMFRVRFSDGQETDVFADEIEEVAE